MVQLQSVDKHKHLGLILSSSPGWTSHIQSLSESVGAMSDTMKKIKYDLDRHSL